MASNTALPTGEQALGEAFDAWRRFAQATSSFDVGRIVDARTARSLGEAEIAAYDAPFPDDSFKAGARQFPALVPDDPGAAVCLGGASRMGGPKAFERPFVCAFGGVSSRGSG